MSAAPADVELSSLTTGSDDEHVCALTVAGRADLLLTFDRGYVHEQLRAHGVVVLDPDTYLTALLAEEPDAVLASVTATAHVWGGGCSVGELIDALARARAEQFAARLRATAAGL